MGRFQDAEFLHKHVAAARQFVADTAADSFQKEIDHEVFSDSKYIPQFGSPLEAVFFVWWRASFHSYRSIGLQLLDQVDVEIDGERFRVDFEIAPSREEVKLLSEHNIAWSRVAVEMDGHSFHEKTREQVNYRNRRDRLLQKAGWRVFHLSFDEIQRRGESACFEVIIHAMESFAPSEKALGKAMRAQDAANFQREQESANA